MFSLTELILKGIPEGFMFILNIFIFTRTKVEKKNYILLSVIFIVVTYIIRLMGVNPPANTLLSIFPIIIGFMILNKEAQIPRVIVSVIAIAILIIVSEIISMSFLLIFFKKDTINNFLAVPQTKTIAGIPSTIIFSLMTLASPVVINKVDKIRKTKNGKHGKKTS